MDEGAIWEKIALGEAECFFTVALLHLCIVYEKLKSLLFFFLNIRIQHNVQEPELMNVL